MTKGKAMNKVSKFVAVSCAAGIAAFSLAGSASAQEWHGHRHHGGGGGDAVAAGVAGLALGVIAGAAIASPPPPRRYYYDDAPPVRYYEPPPRRVYYRPAPAYYGGMRPWTPGWYNYCANRYRTFDPQSGTFVGYDGREHFCNAG
jgi:hypothetical protein